MGRVASLLVIPTFYNMAQQPGIIEFGKKLAREIADDIFTGSQENLIEDGSVDTSNLLFSGSVEEKEKVVIIRYDAPYAEPINSGTKPHFVPAKELEGWVRRKINPGSEKKVKQVAFLVARKISKRGTVPTFFMDRAIESSRVRFGF